VCLFVLFFHFSCFIICSWDQAKEYRSKLSGDPSLTKYLEILELCYQQKELCFENLNNEESQTTKEGKENENDQNFLKKEHLTILQTSKPTKEKIVVKTTYTKTKQNKKYIQLHNFDQFFVKWSLLEVKIKKEKNGKSKRKQNVKTDKTEIKNLFFTLHTFCMFQISDRS
jgi:hypothetical protein